MKPVMPSTATCQRPGTSWRFIPPSMNSQIRPSTISIHKALLVKMNGDPVQIPDRAGRIWNWCIGSMCFAATLRVFPRPAHSGRCCEIFQTSHMATPNPRNSIATQIPCVPASRSIT